MKKLFCLLFVVLVSCNTQTTEEKIQNLNGYWSIAKVETSNGESRAFGFSPVVDYIEIENKEGFRKKVKPQLGGSFLVTDNIEKINVKVEGDSINLHYSTKMDQWKETLVSSEENELVFKNEQGKLYTYKRFTGILDEKNGKAEQ